MPLSYISRYFVALEELPFEYRIGNKKVSLQ